MYVGYIVYCLYHVGVDFGWAIDVIRVFLSDFEHCLYVYMHQLYIM